MVLLPRTVYPNSYLMNLVKGVILCVSASAIGSLLGPSDE